MPQFCILRRQIEIQVAVVYTRLDHCSLEPLIEGRDGDPIGVTCKSRHPARTVRSSILAWHNICPCTSWHTRIVVAWQHPSSPDFLRVVRAIGGIDFAAQSLVYCCHVTIQDAPVACAEEMNTVKHA